MRLTDGIVGVACAVVLACAPMAPADVLHVPGEYATIQAAIDAAVDGDEIVLAAGTYAELVDLSGKNVTLRSVDPADDVTVETTVIDFSADPPARLRVDSPSNTLDTMIDGVTLRFDRGTPLPDVDVLVTDGALAVHRTVLIGDNDSYSSFHVQNAELSFDACRTTGFAGIGFTTEGSGISFQDCEFGSPGGLPLESVLQFRDLINDPSTLSISGCQLGAVQSNFEIMFVDTESMPTTTIMNSTFSGSFPVLSLFTNGDADVVVRDCSVAASDSFAEIYLLVRGGSISIESFGQGDAVELLAEVAEGGTIRISDSDLKLEPRRGDVPFVSEGGAFLIERSRIESTEELFFEVEAGSLTLDDVVLVSDSGFQNVRRSPGTDVLLRNAKLEHPSGSSGPIGFESLSGDGVARVEILDGAIAQIDALSGDDVLIANAQVWGFDSSVGSTTIALDSTLHLLTSNLGGTFTAVSCVFDGGDRPSTPGDSLRLTGGVTTLRECVITGMTGGAAPVHAFGDARVVLIDNSIINNSAVSAGAVRASDTASVTLVRCDILAGWTLQTLAIARSSQDALIEFVGCRMVGNTVFQNASDPGLTGLILGESTRPVILDSCTIVGNEYFGGEPLRGNVLVTNSLIQDTGHPDPMFARLPDPGDDGWYNWRNTPDLDESANNDYGDLRLLPGSPAIDAGDSSLLPADALDLDADGDTAEPLPLDLDGNPRVVDDPATPDTGPASPAVDLGAYEFQPGPCPADVTGDGVLNFDDIDAFVLAFLGGDLLADLDASGTLNFDDIDAFVAGFLAGCP